MSGITLLAVLLTGAPPSTPHFDTEVLPVLTKAGCNSGACHGAAAGRGGFHLSLFGGEPTNDYEAIVHALEGRRVNLARPEESLILAKPTGELRHGGDIALPADGAGAKLLARWIASGAPRGTERKVSRFQVRTDRTVIERDDQTVLLRAVATFDGGNDVDVSAWTVFTPTDSTAVVIREGDHVSVSIPRRGRHVIIARFLDHVVPVTITRPVGDKRVDLQDEPRGNLIDEEVLTTLGELRLLVSPQADDATFLRRLRLDLTGTLPTPDEVDQFVGDRSADKRSKRVDQLLSCDEFVDYWTLRTVRTLGSRSLPNEPAAFQTYTLWLRRSLQDGMPLDRWAKELLTATGDSHEVGAANFARMTTDARGQAELVSRVFLGARLQCANCHNHPLDRWTQADYHGLAAVFAKVERGRVVKTSTRGAVTNPRTTEPAVPRLPGDKDLPTLEDSRVLFADWLTKKDNPYFAKAQVNRLWRAMFGRGLVEPVDDLRATNPATHPKLLDRLAQHFIENKFDIRSTLRLIALSRTYGRGDQPVKGNEHDDRYYSWSRPRPLDPEVRIDAIVAVSGVTHQFEGSPRGTRAITLYDPLIPSTALDLLGRCSRTASCDDNGASVGLPAKLHLLNGELLNAKVSDKSGRLAKMLTSGKSDREIVTEFYRRGFARRPTESELTKWQQRIEKAGPDGRKACLEDFLWGLLNSREFGTNH